MAGELVLRATGEVMPTATPADVAAAAKRVAELEDMVRMARQELRDVAFSLRVELGSGTFSTKNGKLVVGPNVENAYDPDLMETELRAAGCPEQTIGEIVEEVVTTSRKVNAARAKRAAAMNPAYAEAIAKATRQVPKTVSVKVE